MKEHLLIVVIEDNDALREATIDVLHHNGFRAMGVACAEDIDDTPFPQPPDIFVVDLNLPGEDGLSLATRLRKAQPKVGIVITTARTLLNDRLKGYESGADIYLPKPVDPQELVLALQALGQRLLLSVSPPPGLVVNKQNHTLEGPAGQCKLSESETRLLLAFANAKEQTLEYWQVATQMSPGNNAFTLESMQARLSQLRKKIQQCGGNGNSIKAIRGNGYRFCLPLQVL